MNWPKLKICVYRSDKMNWKTICVILVLVIAVWSSTEITSQLYHVRFTANTNDITLNPFPYDVSGVSVSVPTSEDPCLWVVNKSLVHHYQILYNNTNILLQPFGVNFTNINVHCYILGTWTVYNLFIGETCPCKNVECMNNLVLMHAGSYNSNSMCNVFELCSTA